MRVRQRPLPASGRANLEPGPTAGQMGLRILSAASAPAPSLPVIAQPGLGLDSRRGVPILRLKAEQGRCSKTPGSSAERRLQEPTQTHLGLLLPPGNPGRSLRGGRRWFGSGIAYGQDRGFCGQRGALGSLSASSS